MILNYMKNKIKAKINTKNLLLIEIINKKMEIKVKVLKLLFCNIIKNYIF